MVTFQRDLTLNSHFYVGILFFVVSTHWIAYYLLFYCSSCYLFVYFNLFMLTGIHFLSCQYEYCVSSVLLEVKLLICALALIIIYHSIKFILINSFQLQFCSIHFFNFIFISSNCDIYYDNWLFKVIYHLNKEPTGRNNRRILYCFYLAAVFNNMDNL